MCGTADGPLVLLDIHARNGKIERKTLPKTSSSARVCSFNGSGDRLAVLLDSMQVFDTSEPLKPLIRDPPANMPGMY